MVPALPIDAVLPELLQALAAQGRAVLQAPPGAGKTTRVPLALAEAAPEDGRILMLEPRRLAARAAAARMAEMLGEPLGHRVGYRMRGAQKTSAATRIEVVTEGILTRMLHADPELPGVGTVIFDEFHERSLQADLGLALSWDVRAALREDLRILIMSATLDAGPVAALLDDAPVITSAGRSFPVETQWRTRPRRKETRLEADVAETVQKALHEADGGVLVFLPGEGEIRRTAAALAPVLPPGCAVHPLFGALDLKAQRAAVAPDPSARKIVLATAIAETSLTIEDVRIVIDAGLARRARFDAGTGMSRLVTERVTRAEADQRRGRAGRVAPGICYRMWTRGEEGALEAFPAPEIARADLTGLALDLAHWGAAVEDLAFLTPPPAAALAEAKALLQQLGALDATGRPTAHGAALADLPLHPRLAHMALTAGRQAAPLAALLNDRDPLRGAGVDLTRRLAALRAPQQAPQAARPALARVATEATRLAKRLPSNPEPMGPGEMAALAYPDRIGLRRPGEAPRWLLSGGRGAVMDEADPLAGARLLVAADLDGAGREARLRLAAEISETELRGLYHERIGFETLCIWDRRRREVRARRQERLGALVLRDLQWRDVPSDAVAAAALEGVRDLGLGALGGQKGFSLLRARLAVARALAQDLPDPSEQALAEAAESWLRMHLSEIRSAADLKTVDAGAALAQSLSWDQTQQLDQIAPPHYTTPLGRRLAIDYASDPPEIALRLQELFGETRHPSVGGAPLRLVLLSPAGRPVAVTSDLPGFWRAGYRDVRKDMRGRYPKHPWPEDPTAADPTLRAKARR